MNGFIIIESASVRGEFIYVSISQIVAFYKSTNSGTILRMADGKDIYAVEVPEQIEMLIEKSQTFTGKSLS